MVTVAETGEVVKRTVTPSLLRLAELTTTPLLIAYAFAFVAVEVLSGLENLTVTTVLLRRSLVAEINAGGTASTVRRVG